ncbi:MAG: mechanosensitive ion channel family protein [Halodesulfurarchaeum sp.]
MATPPGFEWFDVLRGFGTLEARIVLSVSVVLLALILVGKLAPATVHWLNQLFERSLEQGDLQETLETLREYTPWWLSARSVIRVIQVAVVGVTVLAILAVWGQLALVATLLGLLSISMPALIQLALTVGLFVLAYVAIDIVDTWLTGLTDRSERFSKHQEEVAFRVLQIVVLGAVGMMALSVWGIDLGGLLVGAGFLGIVVGMAARQTLGSLIAGFVLMFSRPFEIGDWVRIGEEEGIVTEISIVNTRLENFDGEFVVLPNDIVSNSTIVNRSKKGRLRLRIEVGIDYDADPDRAQEVAIAALKDVDRILTVPRPQAVTRRLGDSAVVIELRFWIDKPSARRRAQAISAAVRAVKRAFDEEGIKIPFPQREVTGREEAGGFRVVDSRGPDEE